MGQRKKRKQEAESFVNRFVDISKVFRARKLLDNVVQLLHYTPVTFHYTPDSSTARARLYLFECRGIRDSTTVQYTTVLTADSKFALKYSAWTIKLAHGNL